MTPLQTATTRLAAATEMLAELRPYVREAAEQKYAAAMNELAGTSESLTELANAPTEAAPPTLAEIAVRVNEWHNTAVVLGREIAAMAEASQAAADAAAAKPAAPSIPTFGSVRP